MRAILVLKDGAVFEGESIGAPGRALGEVVFDTTMVGYQQCLTDPSFRGQILAFTYPLIGNYGSNSEDFESGRCQAAGVVVRELCQDPSNFRSEHSLGAFLKEHGVVGIAGVDTRSLTRKLRTVGVMMGAISTDESPAEALRRIEDNPGYGDLDLVEVVSTAQPYEWPHPDSGAGSHPAAAGPRIVAIDYGMRKSILRNLHHLGCRTIVMPCRATADQVLEEKPDGVLLSPGPGDPARLGYAVDCVRGLLGKVPVFGICLGNQLLGAALGGTTFKLKFGHRGGNHPVKDLTTGRVTITSQNHGYAVDPASIEGTGATVSRLNLNDQTVEGIECPDLRAFSIQYHAEASPGPLDSRGIFKQFITRIREPKRWTEITADV
ncbi:MAG: glutamine-hydrolyzing carbamoyl-phosphate synthase small subunit [Armatimonadota bacterium]